jgi:hypothetical protein
MTFFDAVDVGQVGEALQDGGEAGLMAVADDEYLLAGAADAPR